MSCGEEQTGRGERGGQGGGRSRGGRRGSFRRDCIDFKLLGECERNDVGECWFSHTNKESTASVTVEIPDKVPMIMATAKRFQGLLRRKIVECCVKVADSTSVNIVVSESNAHQLAELEREYKILLSQLYPIGPGWCYIHRDGVEMCQTDRTLLYFNSYKGRIPPRPGEHKISRTLYELSAEEGDSEESEYTVDKLATKSPQRESETEEGLHKAIDRVHGDEPFDPSQNRKDVGVKIIKDHETHMKETLKGALEWFDKEKRGKGLFVAKLEGRVGKILWHNVPEDFIDSVCGIDLKTFADMCHSNTRHSRIFTTDVKKGSASEIKQKLSEEYEFKGTLETFDIKFTDPRAKKERMAVDVRIKFKDGRPNILLAKKNEAKVVVFDVLSLHRAHDVRITFNYFEVVDEQSLEYKVVQDLLKTVSLSDPDEDTISLVVRSENWNVNFIRHKKKDTFCIDDKHVVSVTNIRECQFEKEPSAECVPVTPDRYYEEHIEIELHNLTWDCAFGADVDFSPEKSLALHMTTPPWDIPYQPWQPDIILDDFRVFWENLDALNQLLEPPFP